MSEKVPRGIPSNKSIYLPAYNSEDIAAFQDSRENPTRNLWHLEDITNIVFSKRYQPKYYSVALAFLKYISEKGGKINGQETAAFLKESGVSKATFYNRVLVRLKRLGMVKAEREAVSQLNSKKKYRPMYLSLSKTFGNLFLKIGDSWLAHIDDVRLRKGGSNE